MGDEVGEVIVTVGSWVSGGVPVSSSDFSLSLSEVSKAVRAT